MSKQTFVANTILTAAQMNTLQTNDYNQTVSTKTASYTLVAADAGTTVVMNAAGATTITVNTSLFTAGDTLNAQQHWCWCLYGHRWHSNCVERWPVSNTTIWWRHTLFHVCWCECLFPDSGHRCSRVERLTLLLAVL
jgi:hypothetical protein